MSKQLVIICHAAEVPTDHLIGSECRLSSGPEADQHTSDDRTVSLNLDSLLGSTQQMAAPQ